MRPRVILNANGDPARFADTGLPVVPDNVPDFAGPLAGILAGLDWAAAHAPEVADDRERARRLPVSAATIWSRGCMQRARRRRAAARLRALGRMAPSRGRAVAGRAARRPAPSADVEEDCARSRSGPRAMASRSRTGRPSRSIRSSTSTRRRMPPRPSGLRRSIAGRLTRLRRARRQSAPDYSAGYQKRRGITMRAFLAACLAAAVIAVVRAVVLDRVQKPVDAGVRDQPICDAAAALVQPDSTHQRRVGEKADGRAWLDRRRVFGELDQPVGLGQRGDDARALLRMLDRLDRRRRPRRAARPARIRAGPSSSCRRSQRAPAARMSGSGRAPASRSSSGRTTRAKVTNAAAGLPGRPTKAAPSPCPRRGSRPSPPAGPA